MLRARNAEIRKRWSLPARCLWGRKRNRQKSIMRCDKCKETSSSGDRKEAVLYPQCLEESYVQSRSSVMCIEWMREWIYRRWGLFLRGSIVFLGEVGIGVGERRDSRQGSKICKGPGKYTWNTDLPTWFYVQWSTPYVSPVTFSIWRAPSHCVLWNKFPEYWRWRVRCLSHLVEVILEVIVILASTR